MGHRLTERLLKPTDEVLYAYHAHRQAKDEGDGLELLAPSRAGLSGVEGRANPGRAQRTFDDKLFEEMGR